MSKIIRNIRVVRDPVPLSVDGKIKKVQVVKKEEEEKPKISNNDENREKKMYEIGFREGYEAAKKEMIKNMEKEIEEMRRLYQGAIETFMSGRDIVRKEIIQQVMELVKKGVERIIDKEISSNSAIVLSNLQKGVKKILNREKITIYINPEDYEAMKNEIERMLKEYDVGNVSFVMDREMKRGGVRIESSMAYIDASIEGQMEELFRLAEE